MKTKFSEVKSVRGKMINTLLKPYLLSLVFEVPDINRIKTELKNLMESNFKFDISIGGIAVDKNMLFGNIYFDDDGETKSLNFSLFPKKVKKD
jgi:hypothetical protein